MATYYKAKVGSLAGPIDAIAKTMVRVRGSYALELMFRDYPGEIWVARKDSPMIIGIADGETYVASDQGWSQTDDGADGGLRKDSVDLPRRGDMILRDL